MPTLKLEPPRVWNERGVVVRPLLPLGRYPSEVFLRMNAAYWPERDLAFWAVKCDERPFVGERQWITVEELRLAAAMILASPEGRGGIAPYPSATSLMIREELDLSDIDTIKRVGDALRDAEFVSDDEFFPEPPIPLARDKRYSYHAEVSPRERLAVIFDAIDCNDALMIRGLGALAKAPMLAEHYCFLTEACISLHIAMEASGELIRRHLASRGRPNSYKDAGDYLAVMFDEEPRNEKYFADFYDDRIKALHPASRLGVFSDAPMQADDYYSLYADLRDVYFALLTHAWR